MSQIRARQAHDPNPADVQIDEAIESLKRAYQDNLRKLFSNVAQEKDVGETERPRDQRRQA